MKQDARVVGKNTRIGRIVVSTDGGYTVADIHSGSVTLGQTVRGDFESDGGGRWLNVDTGERLEVVVEAHHCTAEAAEALLWQRQ